jgi:hypothetical protein
MRGIARVGRDCARNLFGSLTEQQGGVLFIVSFKMAGTGGDGRISQAEFIQGCKNGWVQEASAAWRKRGDRNREPGSPQGIKPPSPSGRRASRPSRRTTERK